MAWTRTTCSGSVAALAISSAADPPARRYKAHRAWAFCQAFFGCATAIILFFVFLMKIDVVEGALATISLFGNESRATDVNYMAMRSRN